MTNITTEIREIGPAEASELLTKNVQNRKVASHAISKYVADMKNGDWLFDGAPIRISSTGKLLDGQHRLTAVLQSKTTQKFLVIDGLPEVTQAVMDTGRKRTLANMLTIQGEDNANALAAVINIAYKWEFGVRGSRLFNAGSNLVIDNRSMDPAFPVLLDYLNDHQELREVVKDVKPIIRATTMFPSLAGLSWWVLHKIDYADAHEFFERLRDGAGLEVGSPILALRDRLHAINRDNRMRGLKTSHDHVLALVFKAWNAWREGKPVIRLYYKPGGYNPEPFPEPK